MRDKKYAGIIAGLFVVSITAFTIWGSDLFKVEDKEVAMEVANVEGIKEAYTTEDSSGNLTGYKVVTSTQGYIGAIELTINFDADAKTITSFVVGENSETPDIGGKIADTAFTASIEGVTAPVVLSGNEGTGTTIDGVSGATYSSLAVEEAINIAYNFINGIETEAEDTAAEIEGTEMDVTGAEGVTAAYELDGAGYTVVTSTQGFGGDLPLTITFDADGATITDFVVGDNSETPGLGATIAEDSFISTIEGVTAPVYLTGTEGTGTAIDAVSGATITSTAVATAINNAYNFIQAAK